MTDIPATTDGTAAAPAESAGTADPRPPAGRPSRLAPRFAHVWRLALLAVVALLLFLPGLQRLPVTDRDEALFAQASRQMLESGNWVDIRVQDVPRYKKPVGIYWLQGLSALASGEGREAGIAVYRIPSLIGAVLVVLFTYAIGALFGGVNAGLIAGLLAASTFTLGFEARIAKTDAVLAATVLAAQYALALAFTAADRRPSRGRNLLFWIAIGVGILIKGPITPMIAALTLVVLSLHERSLSLVKSLRPLRGLLIVLLIDLPWLIAIAWVSGGDFFAQSVGGDMLGKIASGQENHGAPPGTYALAALALFWPLTAFLPPLLRHGWRARRERPVVFLLAWALPGWIVFELVATKLPNYVLPFMPALAVLAALALVAEPFGAGSRLDRWARGAVGAVAVLLGLGLNVAFVLYEGYAHPLGLALGLAGAAMGVIASRLLITGRLPAGLVATAITAGLLYGTAYGVLLPDLKSIWLSDRIAEDTRGLAACDAPRQIVVGYSEPSVVFRLGTDVLRAAPDAAAAAFHAAPCAIAVVAVERSAAFLTALSALDESAVPNRMIEGRNLNGMKPRSLQVFVKPQASQ